MKFRKLVAVSLCGLGLSSEAVVHAQQAQPQAAKGQPQPGQVAQRAQGQTTDQMLATCLAIDNQEEIAIARFAQEKADSKDVREFAKMLAKEHQTCLQKLQKMAPEATRDGFLTDKDQTPETTETQGNRPAKVKVQAAGGAVTVQAGAIQQTSATRPNVEVQAGASLDALQMHREIAEQCLSDSKRMLSEKSGAEFDECFVGHQIAKHAAMKTKLVVFQRHASADLNPIIAEAIEATEKHMKKAEGLMKSLAHADSDSKDDKSEKSDK
jgi:predicted outer membrane protein